MPTPCAPVRHNMSARPVQTQRAQCIIHRHFILSSLLFCQTCQLRRKLFATHRLFLDVRSLVHSCQNMSIGSLSFAPAFMSLSPIECTLFVALSIMKFLSILGNLITPIFCSVFLSQCFFVLLQSYLLAALSAVKS